MFAYGVVRGCCTSWLGWISLAGCFATSACGKAAGSAPAPSASAAAAGADRAAVSPAGSIGAVPPLLGGAADDAGGLFVTFGVDPKSQTHVELPGLQERIKGDTSSADGDLAVALKDLTRTRGRVRIDLSTFTTHTFGNDKDATQTEHARTWLEVEVGGQRNERMRWATWTITLIDGASAADLSSVAPAREGSDEVRRVKLTAHGDLTLHDRSAYASAPVEVLFRSPAGAPPGAAPSSLEIRSLEPLAIKLKDFGVEPRDPAGKILAWTTQLVAKVADTASVTVDLVATPVR